MAVTFDGPNLRIILESAVTEVDAQVDLYSAWKDWVKTPGNEVHPFAFATVGGQPTTAAGSVAPYFFLRNDLGWRMRPPEEDINITITGNVYGTDPAEEILEPSIGAYTVLIAIERDATSVVEEVSGAGLTVGQFLALK